MVMAKEFEHVSEAEYIRRIAVLEAQVFELLAVNQKLQNTVENLVAMLGRNSRNSSMPPSSDGYAKPCPKSLREKSGKKPGAQNGHKGNGFKIMREPDEIREHKPCQCSGCPHELICVGRVSDTRYEVDISLSTRIVAHKAYAFQCTRMKGQTLKGSFPNGINSAIQYGANVAALATALTTNGMMSVKRTHEILSGVFGVPICVGTVASFVSRCADQVKTAVSMIKEKLASSELAHFDETGIRAEGKLHWVHSASDKLFTFLSVERKRGKEGMDTAGVLPRFKGTAIHDCWKPYFDYTRMSHGLCVAHILRELVGVHENTGQTWAKSLIELLLEIKKAKETLTGQEETRFPDPQWASFSERYDALVADGIRANPLPKKTEGKRGRAYRGKVLALAERLVLHKGEVCLFATDFSVPFDNNLAERDLRMLKVKQKVSGCFRTERGASEFATIMSYTATCRKHGVFAFEAIKAALIGDAVVMAFS